MWLAVLEAKDGSWSDDPLPTDGMKEDAISNARAMWPTVPTGHVIAIYNCNLVMQIGEDAPVDHERTCAAVAVDVSDAGPCTCKFGTV